MEQTLHLRQLSFGLALGSLAAVFACTPGWYAKAAACAILVLVPVGLWMVADANRWVLGFICAAWLLPPLPIRLGDSGPHMALVVVFIGIVAGIVRGYGWRFQADGVTAIFLALPLLFTWSSGLAGLFSGANIAVGSFARVVLFSISIYVFFYVRSGPFSVDSGRVRLLLKIIVLAATLSAVYACLDFYFQFPAPAGFAAQFIWLSSGIYRRAQGVFYEASTMGNLCAFALSLVAVCLFSARDICPAPKWMLGLAAIPLFGALVLSYSRASILALGIAIVLLCWLKREHLPLRRYLTLAAVFGVIPICLFVNLAPKFAETYWLRLYYSFTYFGTAPDSILSGRVRSWESLIDLIGAHPWQVFIGIGFKTLAYAPLGGAPVIADNTYLSSFVETGILGLALVLLLNIVILFFSYRASQSGGAYKRLLGSWMFCFWAGEIAQMFSGDLLTYWRLLPAFFAVFALVLRLE